MTRGWGINDSIISTFFSVMPKIPICTILDNFTGIIASSSEQHKDLRPSNITQDVKDYTIFLEWFKIHSPLLYKNGLVAGENVNCDKAYELGIVTAKSITGVSFADVHLQHKDKVITFNGPRKLKVEVEMIILTQIFYGIVYPSL